MHMPFVIDPDYAVRVRRAFPVLLLFCVAAGIASRCYPLGNEFTDKYLGDALYAVAVYLVLGIIWPDYTASFRGWTAASIMGLIEGFQLTGIPKQMALGKVWYEPLLARVLGTYFSWFDLAAYGVGLGVMWLVDTRWISRRPY